MGLGHVGCFPPITSHLSPPRPITASLSPPRPIKRARFYAAPTPYAAFLLLLSPSPIHWAQEPVSLLRPCFKAAWWTEPASPDLAGAVNFP